MEPFSLRNWKEELQTVREVPNKNRPEQLLQERAMFKGPETPAGVWSTSVAKNIDLSFPACTSRQDSGTWMELWTIILSEIS
ncbi:clustered mitochondria protein homolog isoform X7 [Saimiri boliviensis]|uniref:clustered mitochondria protein homolog isoform X7 n=1 Tax=Saimiri boliviensis TaxID=27679 RepID=UPI003D776996